MLTPVIRHLFSLEHRTIWEAKKEPDRATSPISYFYDFPTMLTKWGGYIFPQEVTSEVTFVGPGGIVYFRFKTKYGDILMVKTFQPRGPLIQHLQDVWYSDPNVPRLFTWFVTREAISAFADDIFVWANKSYSFRPVLARDDGPVPAVRRWYRQFYSKFSYRLPPLVGLVTSNKSWSQREADSAVADDSKL